MTKTKTQTRTCRQYTVKPADGSSPRFTFATFPELFGVTGKMFPDANIAFEQDLIESTITVKDMDSNETLATIEAAGKP